jgi:multidrug efflux system membrane fusion protein
MLRLLALTALLATLLPACRSNSPSAPPPAAVVLATVERRHVPVVLRTTGTVEPVQSAAVAAQVDGLLERVFFAEGEDVVEGQRLFQIDPRPYAAALAQAEAALARDVAQAANADRDLRRFEDLAGREFVTAQQLDQARAAALAMRATLQADSAAVARARVDLERATVRAPISGRAGGLRVRAGNLVRGSSGEPLVVINQISPILVRFPVPATELPALSRAGPRLPVRAVPVGDTATIQSGTLTFIDNAVDSLTGTILLKASFANRERVLWPGGLVRVSLTVSVEKDALVVPVSAVLTGQQGASVFVLVDSARVALRRVTVVRMTDEVAVLAAGVSPGEQVVSDGQVRLVDGSRVQVMTPPGQEAAR